MRIQARRLTWAASVLALTSLLPAQTRMTAAELPTDKQAQQEAEYFSQLQVPGKQVRRAVAKLTKNLRWHKTLDKAVAEAMNTGKPILWIQALGQLKGYT